MNRLLAELFFCAMQFFHIYCKNCMSVQDDMASVSGRSIGVGSEVGELADIAADDNVQASGTSAAFSSVLCWCLFHCAGLPELAGYLRVHSRCPTLSMPAVITIFSWLMAFGMNLVSQALSFFFLRLFLRHLFV